MDEGFKKIIEEYSKPLQHSDSISSIEMARKAIEFETPTRIPYSFINPFQSDFFECAIIRELLSTNDKKKLKNLGDVYYDEWGVGQKFTGRGWDHAFDYPLKDLRKLDSYKFPNIAAPQIYSKQKPYILKAKEAGKYIIGYDPVMIFERARSLMGFEELMIAHYSQPEGLKELLERLSDLTIAVVEQWAAIGNVNGFMTWDDWGLQTGLQMKVETFREYYKPFYSRIIDSAHKHGMHYIWHNCGQIIDMIPDMVEIEVDVIQLDQPRLMGHEKLSRDFGGKICFWNTVDIQWSTQENVTEEELKREVIEMIKHYNRIEGGFMARQYPQPKDINLSSDRCKMIAEAFFEFGCG